MEVVAFQTFFYQVTVTDVYAGHRSLFRLFVSSQTGRGVTTPVAVETDDRVGVFLSANVVLVDDRNPDIGVCRDHYNL